MNNNKFKTVVKSRWQYTLDFGADIVTTNNKKQLYVASKTVFEVLP
ncbi:MAG: hypothetical protein OQL19_15615 [Gammaproteobacteria bacterium]|nr:hypothetical protein [Gammaproteobacteria bacterium]